MTSQRPTNRFPAWKSSENHHVFLYFFAEIWYNRVMDKETEFDCKQPPETVTISRRNTRNFRLRASVSLSLKAAWMCSWKHCALPGTSSSASSEKSEEPLMEQLSFLFNEAEVFAGSKHKNRKKPLL